MSKIFSVQYFSMNCMSKVFFRKRFLIFYVLLIVFLIYNFYSTGSTRKNNLTIGSEKNKLILFWTPSWSNREHPVAGWDINENTLKGCEYQCEFTDDQSRIDQADAIIYHAVFWTMWESMKEYWLNQLPSRNERNWDQVWTFLRVEPPTTNYVRDFRSFDNVFNWTATYRLDSDVPYLYGTFEKRSRQDFDLPTIESLSNKNLIGWMDSHTNCRTTSRREDVMAALKNHINVDVYGDCGELGHLECSGKDFLDCYEDLASKYKFWAVFENSNCFNYLSEKFFKALQYGMVPVVYAHPTFKQLVPENSYIDIAGFPSMKELADHLQYLDKNPQEYLKYFEWKKRLEVHANLDSKFWCTFCTKLSTNVDESGKLKRKSYVNIHDWWYNNNSETSVCNHEVVLSSLVPFQIFLYLIVFLVIILINCLYYSIIKLRYSRTNLNRD